MPDYKNETEGNYFSSVSLFSKSIKNGISKIFHIFGNNNQLILFNMSLWNLSKDIKILGKPKRNFYFHDKCVIGPRNLAELKEQQKENKNK